MAARAQVVERAIAGNINRDPIIKINGMSPTLDPWCGALPLGCRSDGEDVGYC
jgi:hypothetical protein